MMLMLTTPMMMPTTMSTIIRPIIRSTRMKQKRRRRNNFMKGVSVHSLQQMFPSLTLFSDIDWNAVTHEYQSEYIDLTFPEYLQQKALDGDCPQYLFELAFFELALFDAKTSAEP